MVWCDACPQTPISLWYLDLTLDLPRSYTSHRNKEVAVDVFFLYFSCEINCAGMFPIDFLRRFNHVSQRVLQYWVQYERESSIFPWNSCKPQEVNGFTWSPTTNGFEKKSSWENSMRSQSHFWRSRLCLATVPTGPTGDLMGEIFLHLYLHWGDH
jgi:hypothetical protein